ncbi:hypothetical protein VSDG_08513 [Cytospora chrysosperma]|uniref:Major facilitator superfamily (MFS) profile domain-containing protein n=1 Tax=Cytospora chrysosperma TaxID=252740 RepID=A0A423VES6_CYTCH|nr:hypothetical protein VSDG_08513 [Valsa sordida]
MHVDDDKQANVLADSQGSISGGSNNEAQAIDWTEEEERKLVRRLDLIVMPPLVLALFALQLDRGNIGNALTDFFTFNVGISLNQYNTGQLLLSLGIVVLEIPSNLILYKVGPTLWIGAQVIAWGLVATFQAFQNGLTSFLVTRLLLGLCESGFIPAGLYTLSRWYKKDEISKRFSIYFFGNNIAAALSGLLGYGMQLEGIYTVITGILFLVIFPKAPENPVSFMKIRLFNDRESHILKRRVDLDDPSKAQGRPHVSWSEFKRTFQNWRLIPHFLTGLCGMAPSWTMGSYAPILVASFGYGRLTANAYVSIGGWILLVSNAAWGYLADKYQRRGAMVFIGILAFWCFTLGNRLSVYSENETQRFALLVVGVAFSSCWHPTNCSWVSLNAKTPEERSISMAIMIMSANLAGIIGTQLFREDDAPHYPMGWTAILILVSLALVFTVLANLQYFVLNRRLRNKEGARLYHS